MAERTKRRGRISKLLDTLTGKPLSDIYQDNIQDPKDMSENDFNPNEKMQLKNRNKIKEPNKMINAQGYINQFISKLDKDNVFNEDIIKLMPDISFAIDLVISSIMSPSVISTDRISIKADYEKLRDVSPINKDTLEDVVKEVNTYFNEEYELPTKLPEWIKTSLYLEGATVILTLPSSQIDRLLNQEYVPSQEKERLLKEVPVKNRFTQLFDKDFSLEDIKETLEDIDELDGKKVDSIKLDKSEIVDFIDNFEISTDLNTFKRNYIKSKLYSQDIENEIAFENFNISDTMVDDTEKDDKSKSKSTRNKNVISEQTLFVIDKEGKSDIPFTLQIPSISTVPVHTPGNPKDHIGYFVMLNSQGYPLTPQEVVNKEKTIEDLLSKETNVFNKLFKTFNLNDLNKIADQEDTGMSSASSVYTSIMSKYMNKKLKHMNMTLTKDNFNAAKYYLLSRALKKEKVKMIYVPKSFITYMAYFYTKEGAGKTKLEDIKFMLSLKVTLLVAGTMASLANSINSKEVTVRLPESSEVEHSTFLQILSNVKKAFIKNNSANIDINPQSVAESINRASVIIKPESEKVPQINVQPGAEGKRAVVVERDFMEEITRQVIAGLDVPHSALNALSDNEYSRSVANSSLYFGNKIEQYQEMTRKPINKIIRTHINFNDRLKEKLMSTITDESKDKKNLLNMLLNSITISFPKPAQVINENNIQTLQGFVSLLNEIMEIIFSEDIIANLQDDEPDSYRVLKGNIKSKLLTEFLTSQNMINVNLVEMSDFNIDDISERIQSLFNVLTAIKHQKESFKSSDSGSPGF